MKGAMEAVFASVAEVLVEGGDIPLENYYVDGTKIEANANKHRGVWAKRNRPWAAETSASQLVNHAYRLSSILWDDAEVVEFASLVSRASQIRALGS